MDRVRSTISNRHADRVNSAWFGQPGTLIKSYEANRTAMLRAGQHACDGSAEVVGWAFLPNGKLRAPADPFNAPALAKRNCCSLVPCTLGMAMTCTATHAR
jgi:hypothetical protein